MRTYSDGTGTDQRALSYESAFFLRHTTVPKRTQSLDELSIPEVDRWSWTYIQRPYRDRIFESASGRTGSSPICAKMPCRETPMGL